MDRSPANFEGRPNWSSEDESSWRKWWQTTPKDFFIEPARALLPTPGEYLSNSGARFLALIAAHSGMGKVSPNPTVGCVIRSKEKKFLTLGSHLFYGQNHAEINALSKVSPSDLEEALVTVTLEPCSHFGKTPPCATALSKLPVGKIEFLMLDPNPNVSGKGQSILVNAGKNVIEIESMRDFAADLIDVFLFNQLHRQIFCALKVATSIDGIYAFSGSKRHWITGSRSIEYGHFLRQKYDAILIGAKTFKLDNPTLNVRNQNFVGRTPYRVVLDPKGECSDQLTNSNLLNKEAEKVIFLIGRQVDRKNYESNLIESNLISIEVDSKNRFQWNDIKTALWIKGVRSLLIEGGAGIWSDFLKNETPQKIHWFRSKAPLLHESNALKFQFPDDVMGHAQVSFNLGNDEYLERAF